MSCICTWMANSPLNKRKRWTHLFLFFVKRRTALFMSWDVIFLRKGISIINKKYRHEPENLGWFARGAFIGEQISLAGFQNVVLRVSFVFTGCKVWRKANDPWGLAVCTVRLYVSVYATKNILEISWQAMGHVWGQLVKKNEVCSVPRTLSYTDSRYNYFTYR